MKRLIEILSVGVVLATAAACAQSPEPKAEATTPPSVSREPATDVATEIERLERDWVAAIVARDTGALDGILAADFNGTSPTGSTFPKDDAIEELKSGLYVVQSMNLDEVSVNVYGNTAVAFTSQQEKSEYGGKDNSGHYHFTNVWVNRNGKWQVVASHGSRYGK